MLPRTRRGFTLIELLVVIAIIAILAAILFPVFAQARAKARGISCLSNALQIGTAFHMYVQDYDEICPAMWGGSGPCQPDGTGCSQEWWYSLMPYIKNIDLVYCSERTDGTADDYNAYGQAFGIKHFAGYGYNWGPIGWRGGGLLNTQLRHPSGQSFITGRSLAAITYPAETYAFGDTYDTPRMTVGIGFSCDSWPGTSNGSLRHQGGLFNYGFVDGHAKTVKVRAGFMDGAFNNKFLMPANTNVASRAYCADPDEIIVNGGASPDGDPVPSPIRCGDIPQWIVNNFPPCPPGGGGSNCFFTN